MLDQNTDRMWYVIGAVLVGAAIILIANGTLPQIFASVTDTFDNSIVDVSRLFGKYAYKETNFVMRSDVDYWDDHKLEGADGEYQWIDDNTIRISTEESYMGGIAIPPEFTEKDMTYKMTFDVKKIDGSIQGIGGHLLRTRVHSITIDGKRATPWELGMNRNRSNQWDDTVSFPDDNEIHHIEVEFTKTEPDEVDPRPNNGNEVWIQPNRTKTDQYVENALDYVVEISNLKLYQREIVEDENV